MATGNHARRGRRGLPDRRRRGMNDRSLARGLTAPNGIQFNKNDRPAVITSASSQAGVFEIGTPTGTKECRDSIVADTIPVPEASTSIRHRI